MNAKEHLDKIDELAATIAMRLLGISREEYERQKAEVFAEEERKKRMRGSDGEL